MLASGGSKIERAERQVVGGHAVDQKRDRLLAIAGRVERERCRCRESASRRTPSAMARPIPGTSRPRSVKWRPFSGICCTVWARDDVADRGRGAIDERHLRADDHGLISFANGQEEVAHQRAADVDVQRLDDLGAKTGRLRRDRIGPGRDRGDVVVPFAIGDDGHGETGRVVAHADRGAGITAPDSSNTRPRSAVVCA